MPDEDTRPEGQLRPIHCFHCGANNFVSSALPPMTTMPCNKCGKEIMIPYLLRNFEIRQVIASGGMGTVYRAFDTILKREVAVKLMKRELGRDQKVLDEFYKEARMIAALNHPNVIQVFNFGEMDGENFIAMELADQGSLDSRFRKDGKLSELEILDVGVKISGALDALLKRELIHRDIKPANILYNADNEPKLVDFGLACDAHIDPDPDGEVWGTPEFAAPEKFRREAETFRADIYSLGCTLYQALTGQLPFTGSNSQELVKAHLHARVVPPNEIVPEVSDDTSQLIVRMLAKKPRERFENYDELVMAFTAARSKLLVSGAATKGQSRKLSQAARGLTGALPAELTAATAAEQLAAPVRNKKSMILAGVAVAAVLIVGAIVMSMGGGKKKEAPVAQSKPVAPQADVGEWIPLTVVDLATCWTAAGGSPLKAGWKSVGGDIEFTGTGAGVLTSIQSFDGFELEFEWKATGRDDQGSVFIGLPTGGQVAGGDAMRFMLRGPTANAGKNAAGALIGVMTPSSNIVVSVLGEFNKARLVAQGNRVDLRFNNNPAVSFTLDNNRLKKGIEVAKNDVGSKFAQKVSGHIGFDLPPGIVIRNARIRAIDKWPASGAPKMQLTKLERPTSKGPVIALSGDKADAMWRHWNSDNPPKADVWKFDTAFITAQSSDGAGPVIATRERFNDFELELEWRATKDAKAFLVFGLQEIAQNAVNSAYRICIGDPDSTANKYGIGDLAGIVRATDPRLRPLGQFNAMRIVSFGDKAEVHLNGVRTVSFDLKAGSFKQQIPSSEYKNRWAFGKTLEGFIALTPSEGITIRGMKIQAIAQAPPGFGGAPVKAAAKKPATPPKNKK